jgi:hypothetical protein
MGRDAHLRDECATTMKHLVTEALQFDKDNICYPKIGKEDVSIVNFSSYRKSSLHLQVHAALHEKMDAAAEGEVEVRGKTNHSINLYLQI